VGMIKAEVGRKRGRDLFVARLRVGKASGKRRDVDGALTRCLIAGRGPARREYVLKRYV
jgi:hypothetical protein